MPTSPRSEIFEALSLLRPYDITSHSKCRVGRPGDTGYVMFNDVEQSGPVYSFGIGTTTSFDAQLAEMGKQIYMFDPTTSRLPSSHRNFNFYPSGLAHSDQPIVKLYSLDHYIDQAGHIARSDMVLKVDIEGAEWEVLSTVSVETLLRFRQIVLEIHWLHHLTDEPFRKKVINSLQKLNNNFVLGHVHSNNHVQISTIEGFVCADVLQLTYLRADIARHVPSRSIYPMELDYPSLVSAPDHLLWFYPFLPSTDALPVEALQDSVMWSEDTLGMQRAARLTEETQAHEARIARLRLPTS